MILRLLALLSCVSAFGLLLVVGGVAEAVDSPELDGSARILVELPGRKLVAGSGVTLGFEGGRAFRSDGCSRFTGTFRQSGASLSFGPTATKRKACSSPEGIIGQEQQLLKALGTVATARLEGDRLELRTQDGALAATLKKAPDR